MPEAPEKQTPEAALASLKDNALLKHLHARASTTAKEMELKREGIAGLSASVEALATKLLSEGDKMPPDEYQRTFNTLNTLAMLALVEGQEYVCDCLSWRRKFKTSSGKVGYDRLAVADVLTDLAQMMSGDDYSVLDMQSLALEMLNDIGCGFKAFKDENGVHDDKKYLVPEERGPQSDVQPETVADDSVVTDEERKPETPQEAVRKMRDNKRGK